jgi:hypothetical protein
MKPPIYSKIIEDMLAYAACKPKGKGKKPKPK